MLNWSEQTVIVTGASGFVGRHMVAHLEELGAGEIIEPRRRTFDLRKERDVEALFFDTARATMIIHLAATVGGIGANRTQPGRFFYDNLIMGMQLMEGAILYANALKLKFVTIGTVCSYPKHTLTPFKESDLWVGYPEETNAPYGIAKKALLVMGQAYRQQYGLNSIHVIPTNIYGPGDNFYLISSHVIPAIIRKFIEAQEAGAESVTLWGDGSPTREFLYVKDAVRGIALAAQRYDSPEPVNLGSGEEISISMLAETIRDYVGYTGEIMWDTEKPNGQPRRKLDTSRAEREFNFRAATPFKDGLRETIAWYRSKREKVIG